MPKKTKNHTRRPHWRQTYSIAFVLAIGFGLLGTYFLKTGQALSNPLEFQAAYNRTICIDNKGDSNATRNPIVIWKCNAADKAQQWNIVAVSGGFLLKNNAGTCADDTGGAVGTNANNRVYLIGWPCNSADHAQVWQWSGATPGQLKNAYNSGCINVPGSSTTSGQQLIIYPCSPVTNNARWYEVNVTAQITPSVTISSPGSGATVSGTGVLFSAKASVSTGIITSISLIANGTTLRGCANATTCFVSWNSTTLKNGTYTLQVRATSSGGGSTTKSESVVVKNASPSPPPPSPSPGPSPSPSPNPSPGSVPPPSPSPFNGSGSGSSVNINPNPTPNPNLNNGQTDNNGGTIGFDSGTTTNNGDTGAPLVANIQATNITTNSIALSWEGSNANSYDLKYGTDSKKLDNTRTISSTDAVPTYTLSKLPSGKTIYIEITPSSDTANGAAISANFKTKSPSNAAEAFLWIFLTIIIVVGIIIFLIRRRLNLESSIDDPDLAIPQNAPVYPREDSQHESERLNWWMPEEQRHEAAQHPGQHQQQHSPEEDIPDMYEEGRKRLDDEQKH